MKNKLLGGVSAVAAVTSLAGAAPASAAVEPVRMQAQSFAELLEPIPNATEQLKIADARDAAAEPRLIEAQYGYQNDHHHHHHHQRHSRWWYQQHGYYWYGGAWVLRPRRNYHHHHHHHNNYPNNPPPPRPY
jgi:hypothetical protein